eukprot:1161366-Pelagomonas_calceolata.AAC.4
MSTLGGTLLGQYWPLYWARVCIAALILFLSGLWAARGATRSPPGVQRLLLCLPSLLCLALAPLLFSTDE